MRGDSWAYGVSGAIATGCGLAAAHLVAAGVAPAASPILAVGSTVIDATPTPVKEWAVAHLGTADKPVLLGSVAVVVAVLAVLIGLLARRHPTRAALLLVGVAALAGIAALRRPAAGLADLLPALTAALVAALVLAGLTRLLRAPRVESPRLADPPRPPLEPRVESPLDHTAYATGGSARPPRRRFLMGAAGATVGATVAGGLGQRLAASPVTPSIGLPAPTSPLPALPTGIEASVPGVSAFRTAARDFYRVDTALVIPRIDLDSWRLEIDGEVDHPFGLSFAELLTLPLIEKDVTLNCVSNEVGGPYIGSTRWLGVRVRDLLDRAGIRAGADQILSTSVDGMTISTPVHALTDERDALLAVAMDGRPLPPAHGFPVRMITPGLYGFVGATKWLTRLTATTYAAAPAYWTRRGWVTDGSVKTQARIDTPQGLRSYPAGRLAIGGVAWSQAHDGIERVEIRVDDGPWQPATLGPDAGTTYWRQWFYAWEATTGRHTLTVRATDGTGEPQTTTRAAPFPAGATGLHSLVVLIN